MQCWVWDTRPGHSAAVPGLRLDEQLGCLRHATIQRAFTCAIRCAGNNCDECVPGSFNLGGGTCQPCPKGAYPVCLPAPAPWESAQ